MSKIKFNVNPHILIGLAIMALFWILPPVEPITAVGMRCAGIFLGMIYLWSTVDTLWPSILGLSLLGFSGYAAGGFNEVWGSAIGNFTVLLILFAMILFGGMHEVGVTKYITKWFLTREVFENRPLVFVAVFYLCAAVLSAIITPITSLIILWPIGMRIMGTLGINKNDTLWHWFFIGLFLVSTLIQPLIPFMSAQLVIIGAFEGMSGLEIPILKYMLTNIVVTTAVMAIYLMVMHFTVDMTKLGNVSPSQISATMILPRMDLVQKSYVIATIAFFIGVLIFPSPLIAAIVAILPLCICKVDGKPILDFKEMAYRQMNWGIFFMIAAAIYSANTLTNPSTGITAFLLKVLNPIFGSMGEFVFVASMLMLAVVLTNIGNNAGMAVVLMPVILGFSAQMGLNPVPIAVVVSLVVFAAMLTPAASPHSGMMFGRKDIYDAGKIIKIGTPFVMITTVLYWMAYMVIK